MPLPIKFKPEIATKLEDKALLDKAKKKKKSIPKSNSIIDIIEIIRIDVDKHLGEYKDQYQCIRTVSDLEDYINRANNFGEIAIDTETNGLNPLLDGIVGMCLYFPGERATYVPINHVDYFSDERLPDQLTEAEVKQCLEKLTAKQIYHNAQFDIRVIKNQVGIRLTAWWDTLLGGHLLNENEQHGLKYLHGKYISHTEEKTFNDLFGNIPFKYIPIEYAYLYGAHDAIDTFELKTFQKNIFESTRPGCKDIYWVFNNIEIPMIDVIVDLEDNGVAVDREYLDYLRDKYTKDLNEALDKCQTEINTNYINKIKEYNISASKPIEIPVNITSSTQLAILFYDILKINKPIKDKKDRCMDEDVLKAISSKYPIAKYILDYRGAQKITSTYVNNMYDIIHTDNRVHTHFNSCGAKTGRMSSSQPLNLQNIPSHRSDIRKMFVGQTTFRDVNKRSDNAYIFNRSEEIETIDGWKWAELLVPGDKIITYEKTEDKTKDLINEEFIIKEVRVVKVKGFKVLIALKDD